MHNGKRGKPPITDIGQFARDLDHWILVSSWIKLEDNWMKGC